MSGMCPHCGLDVPLSVGHLTYQHDDPDTGRTCEGSEQNPRCAESDGRPLWNGKPNLRFYRRVGASQ